LGTVRQSRRLAEAETKLATLEDELPAAEAWQVELEARHASLLDDSIAFNKLISVSELFITERSGRH